MRKLMLVRHSLPEILPAVPARGWRLSDEGRRRCTALAKQLAAYDPQLLVTSTEHKAVETAAIVAQALGKLYEQAEGLHEHLRPDIGYLGRDQFEAAVSRFFREPAQLVFGDETADQAYSRFAQALNAVIAARSDQNLAVFTHGTVISLFASRAAGIDPFPFWKQLSLPAFVVLSLPDFDLLHVAEHVVD